MSEPTRPGGPSDAEPTRVYPAAPAPERPPVVEPMPVQPQAVQPQPVQPQQQPPKLDAGKYWAGAAATILVCALLGVAASVIFDDVFGVGLIPPPDVLGVGDDASWAAAGAVFALISAAVLHILVMIAPSPRMFFGWLVGLATVILAVLPWTSSGDPLASAMTSLVWVILGIATASLLGAVLARTTRRP
jgi:hypothetical protein